MDKDFTIQGIKKIKEASINNKLVIFVGSGVSANSGLPSWSNLIRKFADELNFEINESDDSIETFLKIPQIFYNERGEKEYFDKLNESFQNNKFYPNAIHDKLIKLNPVHFVTTNYDDLLEQAAQKNVAFYHTVKSDLDLPYNSENRMIIKMHGDFEMKNIVLKEDDYLSYSSNFLLIENYLRALISTNLILFVGYSANDPNFKLIFQRVKGVLKSHFQRAYLLELQEKPDFLNFNYYKNIGINTLYYESIESIFEQKSEVFSHHLGNKLMDFLNLLSSNEETIKDSILERIYLKLSVFEDFNAILPHDLIKVLGYENTYYNVLGKKEIFFTNQHNLFVDSIKKEVLKNNEQDFLNKIISIFKKANISGIYINTPKETFSEELILKWEIDISETDEGLDKLIQFDFVEIHKKINSFDRISNETRRNYQEMMRKAFFCYKIGQYSEAYELLQVISNDSFSEKKYAIHFISEFNKKYLGKLIEVGFASQAKNIKIEDINLKAIYDKLPTQEKNAFSFFESILNFNVFYQNIYNLDNDLRNIEEQKATLEDGGLNTNNTAFLSSNRVNNLLNMILENHLMVFHYSEVKLFFRKYVEMVFTSYSIKVSDGPFKDMNVSKFIKLDYIIFYFIINFLKEKEINQLLKRLNLTDLKLEKETSEHLLQALENIVISLNSNIVESNIINDLFRKILNIMISINTDIKNYEKIIDQVSLVLKHSPNKLFPADYRVIKKFITIKFNDYNLESNEKLKELFQILINHIILSNYKMTVKSEAMRLIKNILSIITQSDKIDSLDEYAEKIILYLKYQISIEDFEYSDAIITSILIPLTSVINNKFREQSVKIILEFLNNEIYESKNEIYYLCLMNDVFENQDLIIAISQKLVSDSCVSIDMLIDLILYGKIKISDFKNEFNELKSKSDFLDFLIAPNDFDVEKFHLDWLHFIDESSELQKEVFENNSLKLQIQKLLEEEIQESFNQNLIKQFNKYFTPN